jgi:glycosyltransferase involved in cell wall biosynthesis
MTGPTIRHWELAGAVGKRHQVVLAAPDAVARSEANFRVVPWSDSNASELIASNDVVCVFGYELDREPLLAGARHLVVDLYDPFPLENLHMHDAAPLAERYRIAAHDRSVQTALLRAGDVFLCASDRQRDFWIGWLAAAGRINPYVHADDPGLSRLLKIVPFGLPEEPPRPGARRFRGVVPGIDESDFVVIWGGGLWNWFDPLTLIRAAAATAGALPSLRVVFPASASPSPEVLPMRMAEEARALSDTLRLTGKRVFFGTEWIPYAERGSVLLEADAGVSLHLESVETEFSFRTRILDYLWAGLPIVATDGDSMADLIRTEGLGEVVPPGHAEAVGRALVRLGNDPAAREDAGTRARKVGERFLWSTVAQPLIDYCDEPYVASDKGVIRKESSTEPWDGRLERPLEARRVASRAASVLVKQGPRALVDKSLRYVRGRNKT